MLPNKRQWRRVYVMGMVLGIASRFANDAGAEQRLLLCGPYHSGGTQYNEIHSLDPVSCGQQSFEILNSFAAHPTTMNLGPDGLLYVAVDADDTIYRIDPANGSVASSIPVNFANNEDSVPGLVVLANGHILVGREVAGNVRIVDFEPDGAEVGNWLAPSTPGIVMIRHMTITPVGTIAFVNWPAGTSNPNEIREYTMDGVFLRVVIPTTAGMRMYGFEFSSADEILVSDAPSNSIKKYDWVTGSFVGDFVPDAPGTGSEVNWIGRDPISGSLYAANGTTRCVYGWAFDATPLCGGAELFCYSTTGPLYVERMLVAPGCDANDDCDDHDTCTHDACVGGFCFNTDVMFGDVNGIGEVDIFDILCVLDGFAGVYQGPCTLSNDDIAPCEPDGIIDIFCILAVLDAFAGVNDCNCPAGP